MLGYRLHVLYESPRETTFPSVWAQQLCTVRYVRLEAGGEESFFRETSLFIRFDIRFMFLSLRGKGGGGEEKAEKNQERIRYLRKELSESMSYLL